MTIELNKIYCGDCIEIMKQIPENFIDLVLTSPPYNIGIQYDTYKDKKPFNSYWQWCEEWITEVYRILKPDGRCVIVHYLSYGNSKYKCSPIAMLDNIQRKIGFQHHAIVIWFDITRVKYTAWGSWLSASSPYVNSPCEGLLITYKHHWTKLHKGKSTISKEEFIEGCGGIWNIGTARNKEHPAVFPDKLASRVIKLFSYEGDTVLDPFNGIGTTTKVAYELGRNFIGIDISPKYCELATQRININL